jgi:hypothetical protein
MAYLFGETNCLVFFPAAWGDILEFERCYLIEDFRGDEPMLGIILFENKIHDGRLAKHVNDITR